MITEFISKKDKHLLVYNFEKIFNMHNSTTHLNDNKQNIFLADK